MKMVTSFFAQNIGEVFTQQIASVRFQHWRWRSAGIGTCLLALALWCGWAASASSANAWQQLFKRIQQPFALSATTASAQSTLDQSASPLGGFTSGNLAVIQADALTNNTTFTILELDPTAAAPPVSTIPISGTGGNALRMSGSATSTGYLANSNDGTLLSFDAHNSATTGVNANTLNPRGVGTLNAAGSFALQTTYTGSSGNQARGATSLNDTNWFIADQGGLYTNGTSAASPAGNFRGIKSFGSTVYVLQQSTNVANVVVSTISAPTGGTLTGLPGLTNNNTALDFYLIASGDNGATFDVLYLTTTAGVLKFSLVAGMWVQNGDLYTTDGSFYGLAAADNGNGAILYASTGTGAADANQVRRLTDTAGYNAALNIASSTSLYTAPVGTTVKGVAFAPITAGADAAPTVSSINPANNATNVPTNSTLTLNFSEAVNLTGSAVTLQCPVGTPKTFMGLPANTVSSVVLTPTAPLPTSTTCTFTVVAAQVTDADANDPPDTMAANYVFTFTTSSNSNPTISENTATPFINLPATGTGFLSGVISDPTDPGATLGVDFTVGDAETAAGSLTLTAVSDNIAVVPNNPANLVITGAGANRKLKIVPTGVGYATITVTVTDAGSLTATYTISYAASVAAVQPSTTRFHTGASDASTAIAIDANYMFVADDEDQIIRLYHRQNSGLPVNSFNFTPTNVPGDPPLGLTQIDNDTGLIREVDIEASVRVGNRIYWLASHSNASNGNARPNRYRLFATDISGSGASAMLSYVGRYDGLRTDLLNWDSSNAHGLGANHYGLVASAAVGVIPETPGGIGFNIEGLVMAPNNTTAYVCFRAPISPANARTKALVVPVTNLASLVSGSPSAGPATFGAPIELDLGGRGIRSIDKNTNNEYLIVAGPPDSATGIAPSDFRLYTWTGNAANAPVLRTANLTALNVDGSFEGIVEVPTPLTGAMQVQLLVDNGDTIYYNDGVAAKDLAQNNFTKARSVLVTLDAGGGCPTITVNPAKSNLPDGRAGVAYSQTFAQTGGAGTITFSVSAGSLPTGLSLAADGLLSGTPTVNGNFSFTIRATDQNKCTGERAYTLFLNPPCTTITINPATLPNGFAQASYNQTLTATGGTAPYSFALTAGILPNGLNLASDGALTGSPTFVAVGTWNFTVTATDNTGCTGTRAYSLVVSGNGLMFYPLSVPIRLLDTRLGQVACDTPGAPISGGTARHLTAGGRTCGNGITIPINAAALTGNVTTVNSGGGFLTLYPSDATQPTVASINYGVNEVINNVFTVGLGVNDGAFKIFAHNTTDVVVDVTGYYAPPGMGGLYFHPLPAPVRLLETRVGQPVGCVKPGAPLTGNADSTQQASSACTGIPAAARAIVGNATTVGPQGPGFLTLFPAGAARPLVASSNYNFGQVVNGPFSVGLAPNGQFKIYTFATTDLVVDVLGYYSPEANDANGAGLLFNPLPHPIRLLETRPGLPVGCFKPGVPLTGGAETLQGAHGTCDGVTIPATALGVVGNATVVQPLGPGFLTLWPSTATRPTVATSNYNPGDVGNRHFIVGLGNGDGAFKIYTHSTSHLVIDLSGYFAP